MISSMDHQFDLAVIGSGSAGTTVAMAARKQGRSVAVIEEGAFGGTCALRGCDPKKVLVATAGVVEAAQRLVDLGVLHRPPEINWSELMRFKRTFTEPFPEQRLRSYGSAGIMAITGQAQFVDSQMLRVNGELLGARQIVIASGATPRHVAEGDDALLTSDAFLELEALPQSLVFVGGGYITFEFAHVAARAGAQVTILHRSAHPLAGFDPDIVERLLAMTRAIGIDVHLETPVTRVQKTDSGITIYADQRGAAKEFKAHAGVLAAGRIPNVDHLALDAGHIEYSLSGIKVNEYLQSVSNPNVYAAGDAADGGGLRLTPVAGYEGEIVAANLLDGNSRTADFSGLASMVYTIPPLGSVGITEESAQKQGIDYDIRAGDMSDWYSTRHLAARGAFYKVVLEKNTRRLLGATILGPLAEDQINVLALAIRNGLHADRLTQTLFTYPTGSSDLEYMVG